MAVTSKREREREKKKRVMFLTGGQTNVTHDHLACLLSQSYLWTK